MVPPTNFLRSIRSGISDRRREARVFVLLLLLYSCVAVEGRRKNRNSSEEDDHGDIPNVHYLVEMIGKEMYAYMNRPSYRFYIYITIGSLPDERSTIAFISTLCNVLYGLTVFFGFMILPRNHMLIVTFFTVFVGPAIILVLLATAAASLAAFAIYPIYSVMALWTWFFLTSQVAQVLGRHWGLDKDKDGDVDLLDFLQFFAETNIGKKLGLQKLHDRLNDATMDPFQVIHQRLDQIKQNLEADSERLRSISPQGKKVHES